MVFTLEQFVIPALVLIAGFGLGLASRPSAARWKARLRTQAERFARYHAAAEDRIRSAQVRVEALEADAAEREDAVSPFSESPVAPASSAEPTELDGTRPVGNPLARVFGRPVAFFDLAAALKPLPAPRDPAEHGERPASVRRDDLTQLRGVDDAIAARLADLGVLRFVDLATLSDEDEMALEQRLALPAGYIMREAWREQAALLRLGDETAHHARFGEAELAPLA